MKKYSSVFIIKDMNYKPITELIFQLGNILLAKTGKTLPVIMRKHIDFTNKIENLSFEEFTDFITDCYNYLPNKLFEEINIYYYYKFNL